MRTEPEGFADFWSVWLPIKRRNDGRGEARTTFAKHLKLGANPQDIIDGARWYARNLPSGYEYVPLAATWMNRGVWEDDCEKERAFQAVAAAKAAQAENIVPIRSNYVPAFKKVWEAQQEQKKQEA